MKKVISILAIIVFTFPVIKADEGFWLLSLLNKDNIQKMQHLGCNLSKEEIYSINQTSLKDAVVKFGSGCTGEIISKNSLILTNYHCSHGYIQNLNSIQNDYVKTGFWAKNYSEEIPIEGLSVEFLIEIKDVTDLIISHLNDNMSESERKMKIEELSLKIERNTVKNNNYNAKVKQLYNNNQFFLFITEEFRDIRLVGCPPISIGKFGGEIDNWMWPRYTGDFSLFRIYASVDNKPTKFSKSNIPFKPKNYFYISLKGYEENDFTMIIGYPYKTNRFSTSWELNELKENINESVIVSRKIKQDIITELSTKNKKIGKQYQYKLAQSSNYWKYCLGQNESIEKLNIIEKKQVIEKKLLDNEVTKYIDIFSSYERIYKERAKYTRSRYYMYECFYYDVEIISFCYNLKDLSFLLQDKDGNKDIIKEQIRKLKEKADNFYKNYDYRVDEKIFSSILEVYHNNVDPLFYPDIYLTIKMNYNNKYAEYAKYVFQNTFLKNKEKLYNFLEDPCYEKIEQDPIFNIMSSVSNVYKNILYNWDLYNDELNRDNRLYLQALLEKDTDTIMYPDANATIRLNFGIITSLNQNEFYTTFDGLLKKENPLDNYFSIERKLKKIYRNKDYGNYGQNDTLNVAFITNNDITGGNSGSPVLNKNGELIGLTFDKNFECMSNDFMYDPVLQRSINLDIRYILFIIDKYAGATNIIQELTIVE